jgi:amidase
MSRTVTDLAKLLDVIVGYDPEDPITARGVGQIPDSYTRFLDKNGLQRARIGILRESMGYDAEPASADFRKVTAVFDKAVAELKAAGAVIVDPIVIPKLQELLAKRAGSFTDEEEAFANYLSRSAKPLYKSREEAKSSPDFPKVTKRSRERWTRATATNAHYEYLLAREELTSHFLKVMADNKLDAIVHKAVEHQPTFIKDGAIRLSLTKRARPTSTRFSSSSLRLSSPRVSLATTCLPA